MVQILLKSKEAEQFAGGMWNLSGKVKSPVRKGYSSKKQVSEVNVTFKRKLEESDWLKWTFGFSWFLQNLLYPFLFSRFDCKMVDGLWNAEHVQFDLSSFLLKGGENWQNWKIASASNLLDLSLSYKQIHGSGSFPTPHPSFHSRHMGHWRPRFRSERGGNRTSSGQTPSFWFWSRRKLEKVCTAHP